MSKPAAKPPALRRIARDPRVNARSIRENASRQGRFHAPNSARFADAVVARHRPRLELGALLELILRRRAHLALQQTVVHSPNIVNVSPLLTLSLLHPRPLELAVSRNEHLVQSEFRRLVVPERRIEQKIIERLIARQVRECRSVAADLGSERPREELNDRRTTFHDSAEIDARVERPLGRVFRRAVQSVNAPLPRGAAAPRVPFPAEREILERSAVRSASPLAPERISPRELARITDHVIDTIDRGLIASRERRGMA